MGGPTLPFTLEAGAKAPTYASDGAAGLDLRAFERVAIEPMKRKLVKTGLRVAIPEGYEGQLRPRSGLALNQGLGMVNSPGTIDSDYRGEIGLILINFGETAVEIEKGERIAQLVICPIARADPLEVETLEATERGANGFGSTGTA